MRFKHQIHPFTPKLLTSHPVENAIRSNLKRNMRKFSLKNH